MRIFLSYSWKQGDWVRKYLLPSLKAGGCEVLIDRERMRVGGAIFPQMDDMQDGADKTLIVLSPDYLASPACQHEMDRAVARGAFIPCYRVTLTSALPASIADHLYADLRDPGDDPYQWNKLFEACGANLGTAPPEWLRARDELLSHLAARKSVNLIVSGNARWRELLAHLTQDELPHLKTVDLDDGRTTSEAGLIAAILRQTGDQRPIPPAAEALAMFSEYLSAQSCCWLALTHFDHVQRRIDSSRYSEELFFAMRHLITEKRALVVLFQSRAPFQNLIPRNHELSYLTLETVNLAGR